jgi:DNA-binding response OmpR family regulator
LTQAVTDGAVRLVQRPYGMDSVLTALEAVQPHGMVMVAEEDQGFCDSAAEKLSEHNYRVAVARTATEALEAVRTGGLDVLLLDLRLPFVSGLEVYIELKRRGHDMPTILVSGVTAMTEGAVDMLRDMCVKGILAKPFDPAKLLHALQNVAHTPAAPEQPAAQVGEASSPPAAAKEQGTRGRVLVVDDDEDVAEGMVDILQMSDYEVRMALTAEGAEEIAESFDAEIALIDIQLGRNNGLELIKTLKKRLPKLFTVVVTAKADQQSAIDALRSGADDYLNKPLHPHELFEVLDRGFEIIGPRDEAPPQPEQPEQPTLDFFASISHELRDPLNAVVGFSEILSQEMLGPLGSEQYVTYASDIKQAGEHLTTVIDEMFGASEAKETGETATDGGAAEPDDPPAPEQNVAEPQAEPAATEVILNESFDEAAGDVDSARPAAAPEAVAIDQPERGNCRPGGGRGLNISVSYQVDSTTSGANGSEWFELDAAKSDCPGTERKERQADGLATEDRPDPSDEFPVKKVS